MSFKKMRSGRINPVLQDRMIGTNIIANPARCIDYQHMNENYDFGIVHINTKPGLKFEEAAKQTAKALKNSGVVLGGFTYQKKKKRFVMTLKGDLEKISLEDFRTLKLEKVSLPLEPPFQFIQPLILANSLPALMLNDTVKDRNCFHNGNSYLRAIDGETQKISDQQVNICQTVEVKVEGDWSLSTGTTPKWQVLSAGGVTFTDLESIRAFRAKSRKAVRVKHRMLNREEFNIHDKGLLIPRKEHNKGFITGNYVRGNLDINSKNRVDAYLLDHDRKETGDVGQNPDQTRPEGGWHSNLKKTFTVLMLAILTSN
ncbi:hypothetical protein GZ77_05075 [Endozoicomonas montiporae]|uniref:Uncharacterized protein n=2 Tax=Endozoicomonas montiporae TaxID=1027273 RepID=A0A081NBR4_9GAMM|nr:hypothetical protein [Endozoicomonas montiporae]AMO56186.1 hypothetical protein EZMO1_2067 [Endozoicomonas montiporae CL-33]KEQ15887.1 hypothetical protein GZ77_05075 [Endozoicomonas montiporae]